jgi:hypothetical protein
MKNFTTLLLIVMLPVFAFAEQAPDDPNDVPIDGGLSLLMATGAVYAVKKIRDRDKKYKQKN